MLKWVGGLVAALAVLTFSIVFFGRSKTRTVSAPEAPSTIGEAARLAPITWVTDIAGARDPRTLVGRQVALTRVGVVKTADNQTFWVGPSEELSALVIAHEGNTRSTASANPNMRLGQTVSILGEIKLNPGYKVIHEQWKLNPDAEVWLTNRRVYVDAARVVINLEPAQK